MIVGIHVHNADQNEFFFYYYYLVLKTFSQLILVASLGGRGILRRTARMIITMHHLCHERKGLVCSRKITGLHQCIRRIKVMEEIKLLKLKNSVESNTE